MNRIFLVAVTLFLICTSAVFAKDTDIATDCRKGRLKGEASASKIESEIRNRATKSDPESVKTLTIFLQFCADGSVAEDLLAILGIDMLKNSPTTLVSVLASQKINDTLLNAIGRAEGESGASSFVDCDKSCLPRIDKFFDDKNMAISKIQPIRKNEKDVKNKLLKAIAKARSDWHERLKS